MEELGLSASPEFYPLRVDEAFANIHLVRLSEADYAGASFLDERLLSLPDQGRWAPWHEAAASAAAIGGESDFIFHIGHVGSTLLARILEADPGIFVLREPAILRRLAQGRADPAFAARLEVMLKLYARVWRGDQRSLVKATSFVSEIAPAIMRRSVSARAILMFVGPQTFLAGVLAGEATRAELPVVTPDRLSRLGRRLPGGAVLAPSTPGEMAAVGWACEIMALAELARDFADRVLWLDFERLLADLRTGLSAVLRHLRGAPDPDVVSAMLASPHLHHYAKAPEHPFNATTRGQIIGQSLHLNRAEIERGLAWLDVVGNAVPRFAAATRSAAAGRTF